MHLDQMIDKKKNHITVLGCLALVIIMEDLHQFFLVIEKFL